MLVIVPAFCFIFVKTWPRKATKDMMTVKVGKLLLIPSAVLIVIGMAGISSTTTAVEKGNVGANEAYVMVLMLALILSAGYWVAFLALRWGNGFGRNLDVVRRGVPTPAYIAAELQREWGREPTVQEVAAVHQMLTSRHNQALLDTGIGLGALYLMNRNLHR